MHFSKIEPTAEIHSAWCRCHDCLERHDPAGFARARRIIRVQAAILLAFVATIYGLAIYHAAGIAAAFGVSF